MSVRGPRTTEQLLAAIKADGGTIHLRRNGHLKAVAPSGKCLWLASTPSDYRAVMNMWSMWKRIRRTTTP